MLIKVNDYSLSPRRFIAGTKNSYGIETIEFEFNDKWDDLDKTVVFFPVSHDPVTVLYSGEPITVPFEIMQESGVAEYMVCGISETKKLLSLTGYIDVLDANDPQGDPASVPTPSIMAQVLGMMNTAVNTARTVRTDADNGVFRGDTGHGIFGLRVGGTLMCSDVADERCADIEYCAVENGETVTAGDFLFGKTDGGADRETECYGIARITRFENDTCYYDKPIVLSSFAGKAPEVKQTAGQSEEAVMSQKAVTDALAGKAEANNPRFTGSVTVPAPVNDTDAATKKYVDDNAGGNLVDFKIYHWLGNSTSFGQFAQRGDIGSVTGVSNNATTTQINQNTFYNCPNIKTVDLSAMPALVTVHNSCFAGCKALETAILPNTVQTDANDHYYCQRVFEDCISLKNLTLSNAMVAIPMNYIYNTAITELTVPASVEKLFTYSLARVGHGQPVTLTFLKEAATVADVPFMQSIQALYQTNVDHIYVPANSVNAYRSATNWSAFAKKIEAIPGTAGPSEGLRLSEINHGEAYMIDGIGSCTDTVIITPSEHNGKPVSEIGYSSFCENTDIVGVVIGESITEIGDEVFEECSNLESVYMRSATPPILGTNVFRYTSSDMKIYVPLNAVNTYKSATNWSEYADRIFADTTTL